MSIFEQYTCPLYDRVSVESAKEVSLDKSPTSGSRGSKSSEAMQFESDELWLKVLQRRRS